MTQMGGREKNNRSEYMEEFEEWPDESIVNLIPQLVQGSLSQDFRKNFLRVPYYLPEKCVSHCGCCPEMTVYIGHGLTEATLFILPCEGLLGSTEESRNAT